MRVLRLGLAAISTAAFSCAAPQGVERADLQSLLEASVALDVVDGRFLDVSIDSIPRTAPGASLVNGRPRMFEYLVKHVIPPRHLFSQVATAPQPKAALIDNLLAAPAATSSFAAYLAAHAGQVSGETPLQPGVTEAEVLTIAGRFFHPVQMDGVVSFYICAGINGIHDLGAARNPVVETFVFWALAPAIFDADSASVSARAVHADFAAAKASFLQTVDDAGDSPVAFTSAKAALYRTMSSSPALRSILRAAYAEELDRLPFRVEEWAPRGL